MIVDQHLKCKHLGVGTTLTQLRENGYWLPAGRHTIKETLKNCLVCIKLNSLHLGYPKMTNLPKERLELIKPFLHTDIDYTSHLYAKDTNGESHY